MSIKYLREILGGFYFESDTEKTFVGKRSSWRHYAIFRGGGAVVHAASVDVQPSEPSDNTVEVNETDYTINGEKTELNEGDMLISGYGGSSFSGNVTGNKVTVNGGNWIFGFYGGNSNSGNVYDNALDIFGGTFPIIYGGYSETGSTYMNYTYINGGTFKGNIYGGYSQSGDVTSNGINIDGGTFSDALQTIYGGYSTSGNTSGNNVTIDNITFYGKIYGGHSGANFSDVGNATLNTLIVNGGNIGEIYGGSSLTEKAENNLVTINNGSLNFVYGGYSYDGDNSINTVIVNGGTIHNALYGGYSYSGNSSQNIVTINNGTFNGNIYGGYSYRDNGNATGNILSILGGTFNTSFIYGGYAGYTSSGNATGNSLYITGGTFNNSAVYAGGTITGTAKDNSLYITGGTFNNSAIYGDQSGNTIYISGGTFDTSFIDGVALNSGNNIIFNTKDLTAQNIANFDNINFYLDSNISNGDTLLTLIGGSQTDVTDTDIQAVLQSGSPLTNGDTVTLLTNTSGVTAAKSYTGTAAEGVSLTYPLTVYRNDEGTAILARLGSTSEDSSGSDSSGTDSSGTDTSGSDSSGTDTSGSDTSGSDTSGSDTSGTDTSGTDTSGTDTSGTDTSGTDSSGTDTSGTDTSAVDDSNNTVNLYSTNSGTIYGGYTDSGNASNNTINLYSGTFENIYGGYAPNGETSNNTLNVYNKNISAQNLSNFSAMNFYIPNDAANGDTMLTLTDSSGTDLSGVSIKAGVVAGNSNLAVGDTINLLTNSNGLTTSGATYGTLSEGVSLLYGVNVAQAGNSVVANITSVPTINEITEKIINDSPARDLGIIHTSNDFPGFNNGDFPEEDDDGRIIYPDLPNNGIVFNFGGGSMRTKTGNGSYVDSKTTNIDLGWERTVSSGSAGSFTVAPIVDYAHSNNDTYLADGTHGTGSTKYVAGGGAFRKTWNTGFYLEGSARFGKVKSDFQSNDMDKVLGQTVSYSTDANTISEHLGIGRNWRMNKNNLLHVYATYYHAHQGGMHTTLAPYGDEYDISSADSGRFKIGYRMTTRTSKISRIYTGLAYQYEHISGVDSTYLAKNISTNSESISGSSGMLELGWQIKPLQNNPWTVDINATGWVGHQRGVTAFAKIQKAF